MYMVLRQVLVSVMFNNAAYREYIAWLDDNAKNYLVAFGAPTFFFFFRETTKITILVYSTIHRLC